jgi:hypothetical protein
MPASDKSPPQLPAEAYRITADDPPKCTGYHENTLPDAVWRVDFKDGIGEGFVGVCEQEGCLDRAAEVLVDKRVVSP